MAVGVPLAVLVFVVFKTLCSPKQVTTSSFLFNLSFLFQVFHGVCNIFLRRRELLNQLLFSSSFMLQIVLVLLLIAVDLTSSTTRVSAICFASIITISFWVPCMRRPRMSYDAPSNYTVDHGDGSESAEELGKYELWLVPHAVGNFLLASFDRVFISNNFGESLVREFVILSQIFLYWH